MGEVRRLGMKLGEKVLGLCSVADGERFKLPVAKWYELITPTRRDARRMRGSSVVPQPAQPRRGFKSTALRTDVGLSRGRSTTLSPACAGPGAEFIACF